MMFYDSRGWTHGGVNQRAARSPGVAKINNTTKKLIKNNKKNKINNKFAAN